MTQIQKNDLYYRLDSLITAYQEDDEELITDLELYLMLLEIKNGWKELTT